VIRQTMAMANGHFKAHATNCNNLNSLIY